MGTRRDADRWQLPPALLGECREAGVDISMNCPRCSRTWMLPIGTVAGDDSMPVAALAAQLTCTCGRKGGLGASPNHGAWVRWLRKTGQTRRLPYTAAFVPEE